MSSGAKYLKFSRQRSGKRFLFPSLIIILLALIGWLGLRFYSQRLTSAQLPEEKPDSSLVYYAPTAGTETTNVPSVETKSETKGETELADIEASETPNTPTPRLDAAQEASVRKVLENVMTLWVASLVTGDFRAFHETLSQAWQRKDDPASLSLAFSVLSSYKESLKPFPTRGKLVLIQSRPFGENGEFGPDDKAVIRDSLGPESPWLIMGEWRAGSMVMGFTLVLSFETDKWRPSGLKVEIFET
ncbi:MAG: hypothetical protein LBV23_05865 [Deltaproteobacteria bacterium]|jgi:hypothetical protein|nr:hypothetical protein [Deltaproteobacteria bacterium]